MDLIGQLADPDLIELYNGVLVCAFGFRIPGTMLSAHSRAGNYLVFSFDQGLTWNSTIALTAGIQTTNYMTIRELSPGELYLVYDLGAWGYEDRGTYGRRIKIEFK